MARKHLSLPAPLIERLKKLCDEHDMVASRVVAKAVEVHLTQLEMKLNPPANAPTMATLMTAVPTAAAPTAAAPVPRIVQASIAPIKRSDLQPMGSLAFTGAAAPAPATSAPALPEPENDLLRISHEGKQWFEIDSLCKKLRIERESVLGELGGELLRYANLDWISRNDLSEALTLCRDYDVADTVRAWADRT